ncbi:hypothetical protein N5F13_24860 [Comamonas thiooxydans]|uniref:hypothetical protein n=1 Tax=Comamonas thiooxydans TaxID=363952 RepID=UPI00244C48E4|nr:hypothetical protein [Comamonas thiooxydans]MDH1477720.1 hypothetical protein [Comamonas thiooxydans]
MSAYLIERRYVIGVTWQQTVQAVNLKKHAQQLARKGKADYYCTVAPATVGTAKLKVSNQGEKLIALATGVAAFANGHVFAAIRLPQGIWICAAIDGAPATGFDALVTDEEAARARLAAFERLATSSISLFTSEPDLLYPAPQVQPVTLSQVISAAASNEASEPLAKVGTSIPPAVLYTVAGAILCSGEFVLGTIGNWSKNAKQSSWPTPMSWTPRQHGLKPSKHMHRKSLPTGTKRYAHCAKPLKNYPPASRGGA